MSTAAVPVPPCSCPPRGPQLSWRGPDHCSRTCSLTHCQCRRNILIAIVIYLAAFWLPKSLDYSGRTIQVNTQERAIQVHTQERAIQVHTQERAIQVHTQKRAIQVHTQERAIQVHTQERAIHVHGILVHLYIISFTTRTRALLVHRSVISCTTRSRAPLRTRAPLRNLVHYSCTATYSHAPVSCTTRAPLRNLVHHSRASLKYSRALPSCTTLMHHSHSNALSALLTYSRAPLNHS